jgi:metal-responsive CopG/Arc/MetJ family transcriptional regulator
MSTTTAVMLEDDLLAAIDRERRLSGMTRARVIREAVLTWLEQRADAAARDRAGYERHPIAKDEFASLLGAQTWPNRSRRER